MAHLFDSWYHFYPAITRGITRHQPPVFQTTIYPANDIAGNVVSRKPKPFAGTKTPNFPSPEVDLRDNTLGDRHQVAYYIAQRKLFWDDLLWHIDIVKKMH